MTQSNVSEPHTTPDQDIKPSQLFIWILFAFLALIWGASFMLINQGLKGFTSLQVGTMRIAVAFFCVVPFSLKLLAKTPPRLLLPFFLSGLMGNLLPSILFSTAGRNIPSSISGCLNAFTPIFAMLIGAVVYKQNILWRQALGIFSGFVGAVLLATTKGDFSLSAINPFAGLVLIATMLYATNVNYLKYKLAGQPAETNAIMALTLAGLPALIWLLFDTDFKSRFISEASWAAQGPLNLAPAWAVIILGILGSAVGTLLFNRMIKWASPLFASSVTYAIPFVAVLIGVSFGEPFGLIQLAGFVFILTGVFMVNRK